MFPSPFEIKNSELHREAMLPSVAGKIMSDCLLLYLATLSNTCFMNICRKLSRCTLTKLVVLTTEWLITLIAIMLKREWVYFGIRD